MRQLSRRWFLGGAGALIALPSLEFLAAKSAGGQAMQPPQRLVIYFLPNGRMPKMWVPSPLGHDFTLPAASASLEPFKQRLLFMSGLFHTAGQKSTAAGDHARGTGTLLTSTTLDTFNQLTNDISFDQAVVKALQPTTRFRSLQWGAGEPSACDFGASCTYTQSISWAAPGMPLSPLTDPLAAFNQLFGGSSEGATAEQQAIRRHSLSSVLDYALSDAQRLSQRLGKRDQAKLDEYLTAVRQLETRLQSPVGACEVGEPPGAGLGYQERVLAFNDLMLLALRCDQSRVITFQIENGLSSRSHPFIDAVAGHHALSHDGSPDGRAALLRLETWQCEQAADLAKKLAAAQDANGSSLLDNTALLLLPDMGDGNPHDHTNLAPALLGGCRGALDTGKVVDFKGAPLGNLYVTLLQALGAPNKTFGEDGTAVLPGVLKV
ncbi:MAG: DUF1552 domain-containing protein [Myxococcales bacterium]